MMNGIKTYHPTEITLINKNTYKSQDRTNKIARKNKKSTKKELCKRLCILFKKKRKDKASGK